MKNRVQTKDELEEFYNTGDPWKFDSTSDDADRKDRMLSILPVRPFGRTVDIGCGNGFITEELPGEEVWGVDLSENALRYAERRVAARPDHARFRFLQGSLLDIESFLEPRSCDLIVITGVIYKQYIGNSFYLVRSAVDSVLRPGGLLVSCHIDEWSPWRFPYSLQDQSYYSYRQFCHRLEVYVK